MDRARKKYWTGPTEGFHTDARSKVELWTDASDRPLRIHVTGGDLHPSEALRALAVRRVLLALSRFGGQVLKVTVRLAEPANPLGGVDQRCRMRAWLQADGGVDSEAINGRIEAAVGRAAMQLAKRVAWALDGAPGNGAGAPRALAVPADRSAWPAPRVRRRTRARP